MKTRAFLLLAVLCAAFLLITTGCKSEPDAGGKSEPADRLVGQWQGAGQSDDGGATADTEAVGAAMGLMQLTLEFREDGTGTSDLTLGEIPDPEPNSLNGQWQIKETGDNRLVVEYSNTIGGETVTGQMDIEFLSDDRISLKYPSNPDLPKFVLSRASSE